jgi:hypothetical protein
VGELSLSVIHRENFETLVKYIQLHGVLDMRAWLKLNCLITYIVKRAWTILFEIFELLYYK